MLKLIRMIVIDKWILLIGFYDGDINNICDWEFVCDRIDIEGGRG